MNQVSLLPSLFTTGNIFCGSYAILLALNGKFYSAAWCILGSIIFDLLDGQIARLKNVSSKFGMEYDSLSDLVSFGCAPAVMVYMVYLKNMGRIGTALFFIYITCAALRLARFNSMPKVSGQKSDFAGLPTPAASGFIASIFILNNTYSLENMWKLLPFVVLILAALMVSNFTYPATGIVNLWKKKPFFNLVAFILCGTMIYLQPELFLFLAFLGYVLFGIVGWKITALRSVENVGVERSEHETV